MTKEIQKALNSLAEWQKLGRKQLDWLEKRGDIENTGLLKHELSSLDDLVDILLHAPNLSEGHKQAVTLQILSMSRIMLHTSMNSVAKGYKIL